MFDELCRKQLSVRPGFRPRVERLEERHLPSGATEATVAAAFGHVPLYFEANTGQTAAEVDFLARGPGYALFLTGEEAVLSLSADDSQAAVRMQLVGADSLAKGTGLTELPGKSNYFIGSDPAAWRTDVSTFGRVRYANIYPGVDVIYYGNQRQLEYDFVVAPGADPAQVRLAFSGAESLELDAEGNLVLHTSVADVVERAPVLYQERTAGRTAVSGRYVLQGEDRVGFEVGAYDRGLPLVIDPVLVYSTFLGGGGEPPSFGSDIGLALAVDSAGSAYVTGFTTSRNFPTVDPVQSTHRGFDVFIAKLNASGTGLVYSTFLGGNNRDDGLGIAVDTAGHAYVVGFTYSSDFPTANPFQSAYGGNGDGFITQLNATGSSLIYSSYLGGGSYEFATDVAVDGSNQAYVTGQTESRDFPTMNPLQGTKGPAYSAAFVTKFNAGGSAMVYSTYLGGTSTNGGRGIKVDRSGNAYVAGVTTSHDFPTANPFQPAMAGASSDAFVAKLDAGGSSLLYSTYLGGSDGDEGNGIAILDLQGVVYAYVTGHTFSTDFPTTIGAAQNIHGGSADAFVVRFNGDGSALVYSTYLGGEGFDYGSDTAVDERGKAYVTGYTHSQKFPTVFPFQATAKSSRDVFVTKIELDGSILLSSTYLGGNRDEKGERIAVDSLGNVYVLGWTGSNDFPTHMAIQSSRAGGLDDAFITKIDCSPIVQFLAPATITDEAGGTVVIAIRRFSSGDSFTLHFATQAGTATAGLDYAATSGDLTFLPSETTKSVTIAILNDALVEGDEFFNVFLSDPTGAELGAPGTIRVDIFDEGAGDNERFVRGLYHDVLGRGATDQDFAGIFAGQLSDAREPILRPVILDFVAGPENRAKLVTTFYVDFLRRATAQVTSGELSFWVGQLNNGDTPEHITEVFLGTDEYFQKAQSLGSTSPTPEAKWLDQVYLDILGRARGAGETFFLNRPLNTPVARTQVVHEIINADSHEYHRKIINDQYLVHLGRPALGDPFSGFWLSVLVPPTGSAGHPSSQENFVASLSSSPEYFKNAGNVVTLWVETLYTRILGRSSEPAGLDYHTNRVLNSYAQNRKDLARSVFLVSAEYRRGLIALYFQQYLGRGIGPGDGINFFLGRFQANDTAEQVQTLFLTSQEYLNRAGVTGTIATAAYLDRLYLDVLGRARQATETFFLNKSQQEAALGILASTEYRGVLIRSQFQTYLRRAATSGDVDFWVQVFNGGGRDEDLAASLLTAREYFLRKHQVP